MKIDNKIGTITIQNRADFKPYNECPARRTHLQLIDGTFDLLVSLTEDFCPQSITWNQPALVISDEFDNKICQTDSLTTGSYLNHKRIEFVHYLKTEKPIVCLNNNWQWLMFDCHLWIHYCKSLRILENMMHHFDVDSYEFGNNGKTLVTKLTDRERVLRLSLNDQWQLIDEITGINLSDTYPIGEDDRNKQISYVFEQLRNH